MARHWRTPNVTNRPASSGAQPTQTGSHSRAGQRDSNVIELFPSAPVAVDSADADFAALCFALGCFLAVILLGGSLLAIFIPFFE